MSVKELIIPATDGYQLAASLFRGSETEEAAAKVVVINGATGAPRQFYRLFAEFLQLKGVTVERPAITVDS